MHPLEEITQDVHIVGKSIVFIVINTTIYGHSVVLGGHETEILCGLQSVPVLLDTSVATSQNATNNLFVIEFGKSLALHAITQHAAGVTLLIVPAHRIDNLQRSHGFVLADYFRWCGKFDSQLGCHIRNSSEEFQDITAEWLIYAEGTQFHHDVDYILSLGQ